MSETVLAITFGDPGGIGPEIALKAACGHSSLPPSRPVHRSLGEGGSPLRRAKEGPSSAVALLRRVDRSPAAPRDGVGRWPRSLRLVLIGDRGLLSCQAQQLHLPLPPVWHPSEGKSFPAHVVNWEPESDQGQKRYSPKWRPGVTGRWQGHAAVQWIHAAVEGCLSGLFDGMVTGPICKKSINLAGFPFPGHTEYLASLTSTRRFAMMLIGGPLRVVLATRHLPLSCVASALTRPRIMEAAELASQAIAWLGLKNRRLGICALNPHAGDQGLLGREELNIIIPAIRSLRRRGMEVEGPVPADVIFHQALRRRFGAVLAMYHDQGLAPLKMIAFERGINLTLGLPILRTSPDHGTAFDIAGKGIAQPGSMIAAIRLAAVLARRKNPWAIGNTGPWNARP